MVLKNCETTLTWRLAGAVIVFFATRTAADTSAAFPTVGNYQVDCSSAGQCISVPDVNLGYCCALCNMKDNCSVVNYQKSLRYCQLVSSFKSSSITFIFNDQWIMLTKVLLITGDTVDMTRYQVVPGMLIHNGMEGMERTSFTVPNVVNAALCWRLCIARLDSCSLFSYHTSKLTCVITYGDIYTFWTNSDVTDSDWTSYFAKTENFKLLYKISKGIGVDASNAFLAGPSNSTASYLSMAADNLCECYLKSDLVDNWKKFPIRSVNVSLYRGSKLQRYIIFSTNQDDSAATFFNASKISRSTWTDLSFATVRYMSIGTPSSNLFGRYFAVFRNHSWGCYEDNGWMSVNGLGTGNCNFDKWPLPQFAYSKNMTSTRFAYGADFADALLIYVQLG